MKTFVTAKVAFTALAVTWAGSIGAHHSESMFDPVPFWLQGKVIDFALINPHSIVTLEESAPDGRIRRWAVEGSTISQLAGKGIGPGFLVAGDLIEFCAFPRRQQSVSRPAGSPAFVHGQVLKMPDGKMRMWGTYGKLTNCVRSHDQSQIWVDFLYSDDAAYSEWCWKTAEIPTRDESKILVDEINNLIGNPCE